VFGRERTAQSPLVGLCGLVHGTLPVSSLA
jgi:hypothetical protein